MSADITHPGNRDPDFNDAVELLVDRYGLEDAEGRLLAALSAVRYRKYQEVRQ